MVEVKIKRVRREYKCVMFSEISDGVTFICHNGLIDGDVPLRKISDTEFYNYAWNHVTHVEEDFQVKLIDLSIEYYISNELI